MGAVFSHLNEQVEKNVEDEQARNGNDIANKRLSHEVVAKMSIFSRFFRQSGKSDQVVRTVSCGDKKPNTYSPNHEVSDDGQNSQNGKINRFWQSLGDHDL